VAGRDRKVEIAPRSAFSVLDRRHDVSSVLHVQIEQRGAKLDELDLKSLRFYLNGESTVTSALYELMGQALCGVALASDESAEARDPAPDAVVPVGFADDEEAIPSAPNSHPGYRLLQEYLQFPIKFHFFDLQFLERVRRHDARHLLPLRSQPGRPPADREGLGAARLHADREPVCEDQRADPDRPPGDGAPPGRRRPARGDHRDPLDRVDVGVRRPGQADNRSAAVLLGAARRRRRAQHGVLARAARADRAGRSLRHRHVGELRRSGVRRRQPPTQVLYAHTLCTNRELAVQLPDGAALQIEEAAPITRINCITRRPTPPIRRSAARRCGS
jgi:type VI secretion system protein ImpG